MFRRDDGAGGFVLDLRRSISDTFRLCSCPE